MKLNCSPLALTVLFLFLSAGSSIAQSGTAAADGSLALMPVPASVAPGTGQYLVTGQLSVTLAGYSEPRLVRARERFIQTLARETGIPFLPDAISSPGSFEVKTAGPSAAIQEVGEDESYHLEVTPQAIHLTAPNPLGTMHGLQTVLQLVQITPQGFAIPAVTIDDKPRFTWRGLMIDSGRHFMPLPVILRNLDAMEAVKLNVFHWHLSEDQGFRVESKVFPLLQKKGSDGLFYTQEEIKHTIEYARDRGIRVIPEFDMPGHAQAWFVGYPNLASGKGPYEIERHWGVFDPAMDPTRESTYQFLNTFFGEMTALFPDHYFHIGGDECNGKEWDASPRIKAFMKAHNLKDDAALQAYFTGRVQKLVSSRHKIVEGWDEILQPDAPKDVVIQSWRGRDSLLAAAQRGYRGLLSNGYYIDLNQPAEQHYLVDPIGDIGDKLTPAQRASILGGEATMWSEYTTGEIVDSRIWPRTAAIAERYWSPESVRDVESMYRRMEITGQKLEAYGITNSATSEQMLERMSGDPNPVALQVLASVVQPPMGYARGGMREYTSLTPLNHLVDAVSPESETGREFGLICARIATGTASPEDWHRAHSWLVLWRDNDAQLQPLLGRSEIMQELIPVSASVKQSAEIGLRALDLLQQSQTFPTASARTADLAFLAEAKKPQAVLLQMVAPGVETLVKAEKLAGGGSSQ